MSCLSTHLILVEASNSQYQYPCGDNHQDTVPVLIHHLFHKHTILQQEHHLALHHKLAEFLPFCILKMGFCTSVKEWDTQCHSWPTWNHLSYWHEHHHCPLNNEWITWLLTLIYFTNNRTPGNTIVLVKNKQKLSCGATSQEYGEKGAELLWIHYTYMYLISQKYIPPRLSFCWFFTGQDCFCQTFSMCRSCRLCSYTQRGICILFPQWFHKYDPFGHKHLHGSKSTKRRKLKKRIL